MRSSKRAGIDQTDVEDQDDGVEDNLKHLGWKMDLDAPDNYKLRRISRSGLGRIKQQAQKQKMNRGKNFWGWDLLVGKRAGLGGRHMLRSGKRSSQDNYPDTLQHNTFYFI